MKVTIEKINITDFSRREAQELRNEILKITDGNIAMISEKYPRLHELFYLLGGSFEDSRKGVHFL